jgi:hypothetical protein
VEVWLLSRPEVRVLRGLGSVMGLRTSLVVHQRRESILMVLLLLLLLLLLSMRWELMQLLMNLSRLRVVGE